MKLLILIGPDTLGVGKFKTKSSARRALTRIANSKPKFGDGSSIQKLNHLGFEFMGRTYTKLELMEAEILTLPELYKIYEVE